MGYITLRSLCYNLGYRKVLAYIQKYALLVWVEDSLDVLGSPQLLEEG